MYGVVGVAMAVLLYFNRLTDAGLDLVGMREIAGDRESAPAIVRSVLGFRILLALALTVILSAVAALWLPRPDGLVLAVFALTLLPVGASTRFVHLGFERGGYAAAARVAGEAVILLIVVLLVRSPDDALRVPLAHVLGLGTTAALLAWWMRAYGIPFHARIDWTVLRPILRRSMHVVGSAMLGLIAFNADLILLRILHGAETAGWYAAAYMPISLAMNLGIAYRLSLLPALSRLAPTPERQRGLYHTALAHVFAIVMPSALAGMLLAPAAIAFLFGGEYDPAGPVLQLLIWTIPLAQLREPAVAALVSARREDRLLPATAISTALNLALNVLLIPRYGMMGAAIATVGTEGLRLAMLLWYSRAAGFSFARADRFWRVLVATAAMGGVLLALNGVAHFVVAAASAVAVYTVTLLLLGGIKFRRGELPALSV
jgi:O-antigen/teichoic acid export membrane protein